MSNPGIDYGSGQTNIDTATGIRYGVISPHTIGGDSLDEIYQSGENLSYKAAVAEAHATIRTAIKPILDDLGVLPYSWKGRIPDPQAEYLDRVVSAVWEAVEQEWNERYEEQDDEYRYEQDGYILETSSLGIYVIKSPYITRTVYCSPCAPGAGDLDHPDPDGVPTYCLGPDWFEDEQPPYPVESAADYQGN